jgi:hypothetical protein
MEQPLRRILVVMIAKATKHLPNMLKRPFVALRHFGCAYPSEPLSRLVIISNCNHHLKIHRELSRQIRVREYDTSLSQLSSGAIDLTHDVGRSAYGVDLLLVTPPPCHQTKSSPEVDVEGHPDLRETENQTDRVEKNTPHAGSIESYPSKSSPRAGEPSPQTNLASSQPQHVLSVTQHPNVEGSNGEQRGTELPGQHADATVAGLEQQIKDLKHDLASVEGRAKNAISNSEYWRGQYDAISATPSPEPSMSACMDAAIHDDYANEDRHDGSDGEAAEFACAKLLTSTTNTDGRYHWLVLRKRDPRSRQHRRRRYPASSGERVAAHF